MKNNIRGKNLEVTEAIHEYVEEKLSKLDKYFKESDNIKSNVLIKLRGHNQIIEVTILTTNFTIRGEESHENLYSAVDLVVDKLERQIKKNKTKLNKIDKEKIKEFSFAYESDTVQDNNKIVKRKKLSTKPMNEEEAILQMNMLGHDFFIYKDADTDNVTVIYIRKDGNYGSIETN